MTREIKFRAIINPTTTIHFDLYDLVAPDPKFSIREILIPWLQSGNEPDRWAGFKDKDGKEVYGNDIVQVHKFTQELGENMGVVEGEKEFVARIDFSPYGGVFLTSGETNSGPLWEYENGYHEESLKVLGNKHQNPELMEAS